MRGRRPSRLSAGVHEAGHAVVNAALGGPPVRYLQLDGLEGDILGFCAVDARITAVFREDGDRERAVHDDSVGLLAGPIAELRWRRHGRWAILLGAHHYRDRCFSTPAEDRGSDLGQVRFSFMLSQRADVAVAFQEAWEEAEGLVAANWSRIQRIGRLLAAAGRLEGAELVDLLRGATGETRAL